MLRVGPESEVQDMSAIGLLPKMVKSFINNAHFGPICLVNDKNSSNIQHHSNIQHEVSSGSTHRLNSYNNFRSKLMNTPNVEERYQSVEQGATPTRKLLLQRGLGFGAMERNGRRLWWCGQVPSRPEVAVTAGQGTQR